DATVRVKAGEVRKRLGIYYSGEGAHDPVRIELPAGTYVPEFRTVAAQPSRPEQVDREARPTALTPRRLTLAACVVAIVAAIVWSATRLSLAPLDEFWAPVLKG